jgi:hypothetical protein
MIARLGVLHAAFLDSCPRRMVSLGYFFCGSVSKQLCEAGFEYGNGARFFLGKCSACAS